MEESGLGQEARKLLSEKRIYESIVLFFLAASVVVAFIYLWPMWYSVFLNWMVQVNKTIFEAFINIWPMWCSVELHRAGSETIFVAIIVGNSVAIYCYLRYFRKKFSNRFEKLEDCISDSEKFKAEKWMKTLFHPILSTLFGIGFGVLFLLVLLMDVWKNCVHLRNMLGLFLFLSNVITGIAVYAVLHFVGLCRDLGNDKNQYLKSTIWDRSCPVTDFILWFNRRIVLAIAFISFLAMSSLLFSQISNDAAITGFTIWTLFILGFTFVYTVYPVRRHLNALRHKESLMLGQLIQDEYQNMKHNMLKGPEDMRRFDDLRALKKQVDTVRIPPWEGAKATKNLLFSIILTLLPFLAQLLIESFK